MLSKEIWMVIENESCFDMMVSLSFTVGMLR